MNTSSNFGNLFSMAAASLVQKPKRLQVGFIRQFMAIIGPISSI